MRHDTREGNGVGIGHNLISDPLADWTKLDIFFACIWLADLDAYEKVFLLCVGRFFDEDLAAAIDAPVSYIEEIMREKRGVTADTALRLAKERGDLELIDDHLRPMRWSEASSS